MRPYEEYENLDEYETDGEEFDEDEVGEEEYEEEEVHQPTAEELEYLGLRQKLKERFRKKMKKESGSGSAYSSSLSKKNFSTKGNFGSFFGPSQPVIAQRVIQESKSLLENPDIATRTFKSSNTKNKSSASTPVASKPRPNSSAPKVVTNGVKRKAEMLKTTRDYSFLLSDDAELPAPAKDRRPQKVFAPNTDARSSKMQERIREPMSNSLRKVPDDREERKHKPFANQAQGKLGTQKSVTVSKPRQISIDSKKQLPSNNGIGPSKIPIGTLQKKVCAPGARSAVPQVHKSAPTKLQTSVSKQPLVQKREMQESYKAKVLQKQPASSSKPQIKQAPLRNSSRMEDERRAPPRNSSRMEDERRAPPRNSSRMEDERRAPPRNSSRMEDERRAPPRNSSRMEDERRAPPRNSSRMEDERRAPPRNLSRMEDERRAPPRNSSRMEDDRRAPQRNSSRMEDERAKRKPIRRDEPRKRQKDDDEEMDYISEIRNMFSYNPNKYRDDDDDRDMVVNFDEILREEKRSSRIAKEEDEKALREIEEEERRERMRKEAKKRKLSQR